MEGFTCDPIYLFFKDGYQVRRSLIKSSYFDVLDVTVSGLSHHPGVEIEIQRKFQDASYGRSLSTHSLEKPLKEVQFADEVPDAFLDVTYCIILSSSADRPILTKMNVPLNQFYRGCSKNISKSDFSSAAVTVEYKINQQFDLYH